MRLPTLFLLIAIQVTRTATGQTTFLDQGWNPEQRDEFYFTQQGSQLIPYKWFLALEQHDADELFRDDENMRRYGILTAPKTKRNPDALPIGFVRDGVDPAGSVIAGLEARQRELLRESTRFEIKEAYLGARFSRKHYPKEQESWFGLTCAACHTHEIEYNGKTVRIDGGSTQADLESFLRDLGRSLKATHQNADKLRRFSDRLDRDPGRLAVLKIEVQLFSEAVNRLVLRNKAAHQYGYGRLDAFGAILNAVCETALGIPENNRESNAPVSYPSLWNAPDMSHVQWGATADRAEKRNVGEVLGVFGCFSLAPGPNQFHSTVRLKNLLKLEHELLIKLTAPDWPEDILGKLDREKVQLGQKLFQKNCQSCHPVRDERGEFALNCRNKIQATSNTVKEVGTDPLFLANLRLDDLVSTGVLEPLMGTSKAPRLAVLGAVVKGITGVRIAKEGVDYDKYDPGHQPPPRPGHPKELGYISEPLEGKWATAPYFHNGSVPNLYETLLPADQRTKRFSVGTREFDPKNVGFAVNGKGGGKFNVVDHEGKTIPGNSNAGHEGFGANENEGFTQTFENGEWRDFTEQERYALVEYMKSLSAKPSTPDISGLEEIPEDEEAGIANLVEMTARKMRKDYPSGNRMLRRVHPKDHGCVSAKFEILPELPDGYNVGIFQPGATYESFIRFSNAATTAGPDSRREADGTPAHGSRGMAVKLTGVKGTSLLPLHGALTQDFLMVNQPAFAFANVHDYEMFNCSPGEGLAKLQAFGQTLALSGHPGATDRLKRTLEIVKRIRASSVDKGAFEQPPASPVDNTYYGAAPFLFGHNRVMRFRAAPVNRSHDAPNVDDPNYLRTALIKRLKENEPVVFDFEIQVKNAVELNVATDIENASTEWKDEYVCVARITIPPQEFDSRKQREKCEQLFFTPWHGIVEHTPLGGINRLRKTVYLESARLRSFPKEPTGP